MKLTIAALLPCLVIACGVGGTERPDTTQAIGTTEAKATVQLPMYCEVDGHQSPLSGTPCRGRIEEGGIVIATINTGILSVPEARRRFVWFINGAPVSNATPDIYIPGTEAGFALFWDQRCDYRSNVCEILAKPNCTTMLRDLKFEVLVYDSMTGQAVEGGMVTASVEPANNCPIITAGGPDTGGGNGGQEDINPCPGGFRDEYFECPGDPLVIDFGNRGFDFTPVDGGVLFDMNGDGSLEKTAWTDPDSDDAFLVFDRNGNGIIDNGRELFGDSTFRPNGRTARLGYEALRDLDRRSMGGNQNLALDPGDEAYWRLQLWTDRNHNGFSEPNELESLAQRGVDWISVLYLPSQREDENGNHLAYNSLAQVRSGRSHRLIKTTDVFFRIAKSQ